VPRYDVDVSRTVCRAGHTPRDAEHQQLRSGLLRRMRELCVLHGNGDVSCREWIIDLGDTRIQARGKSTAAHSWTLPLVDFISRGTAILSLSLSCLSISHPTRLRRCPTRAIGASLDATSTLRSNEHGRGHGPMPHTKG
jgi:hypothetical protein